MKRTIWIFGLISGMLNAVWLIAFAIIGMDAMNFDYGEVIGYAGMLISFSLIFFGVRAYRDKYLGGFITFGKAFKTGVLIALVSSMIYVLVWEIEYYTVFPDFGERYAECVVNKMREKGASEADIAKKAADMKDFAELYKNPLVNIGFTLLEVFPLGLLFSLVCAAILKKKPAQPAMNVV